MSDHTLRFGADPDRAECTTCGHSLRTIKEMRAPCPGAPKQAVAKVQPKGGRIDIKRLSLALRNKGKLG